MQHGTRKAVLPVKLREARSSTSGGDQDWEHRYVVFGKDTNDFGAFEMTASPGFAANADGMERI